MFLKILAPILAVLSLIYSGLVRFRVFLFGVGVFPSDSCGSFVVSIGNIQAGGTGKTPIVEFFARRWRDRVRVGIVSRGYGRTSKGSHRVRVPKAPGNLDPSDRSSVTSAQFFGDEPSWLASVLSAGAGPEVPVQVGERRLTAARDLIASEGVPLLLLDDGFQHLWLRRSFDIVLVDVSAPAWHFRLLPWGRLREPMSALRRADAVLLTKTESQSEEYLLEFERRIKHTAGVSRVLFGRKSELAIVRFSQSISWATNDEKMIVAAGLARAEIFFQMVRNHSSKPRIAECIAFSDHHDYTEADAMTLVALARRHQASRVLVTEKDAIKLRPLWPPPTVGHAESPGRTQIELVVSKLEVCPARESDRKQLEFVDDLVLGQIRKR